MFTALKYIPLKDKLQMIEDTFWQKKKKKAILFKSPWKSKNVTLESKMHPTFLTITKTPQYSMAKQNFIWLPLSRKIIYFNVKVPNYSIQHLYGKL